MKKFDLLVIGMGPAGMAVTAMGAAMGLSVLSIEKDKVGGECLNCGGIPRKALLKAGQALHTAKNLQGYCIDGEFSLRASDPMQVVRDKTHAINDKKFQKAFERATMVKGVAEFVDDRTVQVGGENYTAKKIFIATGTEPFVPPIPGLSDVPDILTNTNMFEIEKMPESLAIIGGGAIGSEMAQAFSRLGTKVSLAHMDPHLVPVGDEEAARLLEEIFEKEGIGVYNGARINSVSVKNGQIVTETDKGTLTSERILVAAGRKPVLDPLHLDRAGIEFTRKGVTVDSHMRTNKPHIYAVGDCNGHSLLSHAAMHQGMLALMHALSPFSLPMLKRERYAVPWAVFTQPEIAQVGMTEKEAREKGLKIQVMKKDFRSYGRTVADGHPEGFIKIITNGRGRIFGATIIGEAASELIHEWTMAIQHKRKMHHIMLMQHAFPSISMINKMIAEDWMMEKMKSNWMQRMIRLLK
ncbi:MAG: NAD(P)/FAD-dependent oxidoreductase [Synergistaceae bacterium]|nr:NAD(P)/FAD-dependent oxidoreductase [Synergistaceae bacterium]